jgi:hypothetical protein
MPTEQEIQDYIWDHRDAWAGLLDPIILPARHTFAENLSDVTPSRILFNKTIDRLQDLDGHVRNLILLGSEVRLERANDSTIRADLLGVSPDRPGFTIVELKKPDTSTEREAFTQLLGYGNHVAAVFPLMSKEDLVYVLIAPMATRIVRDAFVHALMFEGKKVFALTPHFIDETNISTLRLRPWIPPLEDITRLADAVFKATHFEVWKGSWETSLGVWNVAQGAKIPCWLSERMNQVSAYAAQAMEAKGIHGFAYCSQTWQELDVVQPLTNSLVIVGINCFKAGHALFQIESEDIPPQNVFEIGTGEYRFSDLFPGVNSSAAALHEETDYLEYFGGSWWETIADLGLDVIKRSIQQTDGMGPETHVAFFNWADYRVNSFEDVFCTNFDVRPTGVLRDLYWAVSDLDYQKSREVGVVNHPVHGDMWKVAAKHLSCHGYFRSFLDRLFPYEDDDE